MPDFLITSLRGGMNDTDPPLALAADQCVSALNVEWVHSMIAERRRGSDAIDIAGSGLEGRDRIPFLFRHLPTSDETASELWALGVTGTASSALCRKTTVWSTVVPVDAITLTGGFQYQLDVQTLHGKMHTAFKSGVDRLHVWDGTTMRRSGLAQPSAAPTAADSGGVGTFAGTRYYRVREVEMSGTTVVRRSEPSESLEFPPSGSHLSVTVTKPVDMGEGATHWEMEASVDDANFYRMARTIAGTATVTDSVALAPGYADTAGVGVLSEEIGDYALIPSVRFLLADEDRLVGLSSFEDDSFASRMMWTPVYNDPGVGNDERIPLDPVSFRDLDTFEGGGITGGVGPVNGEIWIFKRSHTYKAVRTGNRASAYEVICITKKRGALPGSMVEGVDQAGSPCAYFLDPKIGPCRIGADGVVRRCGRDMWNTWRTVNINAAEVVSRAVFYDTVGQLHWFVATGASDVPNKRLVLHVDETRDTEGGVRRGWAVWDGASAGAIAVCLYSDNVDAGIARNLTLVPFVGLAAGANIHRTDTGNTDNGVVYAASVKTKPYAPANILNKFSVLAGAVLGKVVEGALILVRASRDFDKEAIEVDDIDFEAEGDETHVVKPLDDLSFSELTTVDFTIGDAHAGTTTRWEVNQLALKESKGQTS